MALDQLPLFPLDLVLYPDEVLPLHIFEDRYQEMLNDCTTQDIPFGVLLSQEGKMKEVGCVAKVSKITESFEDGSKNIIVTGQERFKILQVHNKRSYLTADFEAILDLPSAAESAQVDRLIAQHIKLLELAGRTPSPSLYENRDRLSFFVAHNAGLNLEQKQTVLETRAESMRVEYLITHLERFIPAVEEAESIRQKIKSNGHFKDFPPEV
ncbi:MAG: LON peptidase substrate-binding domain-containing protein [Bacteroidetes bacterium]|nr:LON peptidase substrate-binding domain-containing protein [Bacteroidota bacterium]MDA1333360.1 LON peptidase substrate-binding domain-containing protein [Bacteroidota bacterium]